jgi:hypothetical protein
MVGQTCAFATGYRFDAGSATYGGRAGAELKTRDGMFTLKYEAAYDPLNKTYHTVGGFVNVGIRMSNLLNGESPFVMPEPIFRSPRNLRRRLTTVVRRQSNGPGPPTATASTMARCPMNACGTNPLTPNLRGEYQVNMPATMTNGQIICLDVPDTTVTFGNLSIFITRYGTTGDIYFGFYEASNDCTGLALGVLLPDSQTAYCVTAFAPDYSVWSIRATCVGPTGCDAGCINFQWWQD